MLGFILYLAAPNTAFRRAALPHLQRAHPHTWQDLWQATCTWQRRLAPIRPHHSASVNVLMRQMEWNCALYRALRDHGIGHDTAAALVERVGLDVYAPVAATMYRGSRLRSARRPARVRWLLSLMTRYFFSAPFVHRHLPDKTGVSFDVTVCPLADYFREQGLSDLTPYAACNLDHAAAHAFGANLHRTQTIATGADFCDFRWTFPD